MILGKLIDTICYLNYISWGVQMKYLFLLYHFVKSSQLELNKKSRKSA